MATRGKPIRKVYIDSRFKTKHSKSNSEFVYELGQSVELPDNCHCFVDDVIIPVSWYNIDENSKNIYVRQYQDLSNTKNDQIVPIAVNNHTAETLTEAMQNSLNTAFGGGMFTVTFDERKLKITIQADSQSEVKLFTDDELKASNDWQGADYDSKQFNFNT